MVDLIDEVSQDLQEEKYSSLIKRLIRIFTVTSIVIVVGVSLYVWKESTVKKLQDHLGALFSRATEAYEKNKLEEAMQLLDKIIEHSHQQYAALAYINKASILAKQGNVAEAEKNLLEVANSKHYDTALRELAQLNYIGYQLDKSSVDSKYIDETLSKLAKENKAWRLSSLQLKALHDIKNNKEAAKAALNEILTSKQATRSSYDSASSILSAINRAE